MWDVPFRDHTMWRPLSTKLWLLERQKLQTVFLAQVLRYIHAAWPVASLCWVSALLYTLQTLHLNCKGANLRMYMFVSVWFEGVCVDIKENSLKHLTAVKKTSFPNAPWMRGSILRFAAVFYVFLHYILECHILLIYSMTCASTMEFESRKVFINPRCQ